MTTQPSTERRKAPAPPQVRSVLDMERLRNAQLTQVTRFLGVCAFISLAMFLSFILPRPGWPATVPYLVTYGLVSAVMYAAGQVRPQTLRFAGLAIAFVDMPMIFALQHASLPTSPSPGGVAGFTLAIFALLVVVASLSLHAWQINVVAVMGTFWEIVLQVQADIQAGAIASACLVMLLFALVCHHNNRRLNGLAARIDKHFADYQRLDSDRQEMRQRLSQAERMAALGTLAASIAHEINNPLSYLTGNLELATEQLGRFDAGTNAPWDNIATGMRLALDDLDGLMAQHGAALPAPVRHDLRNLLTPLYVNIDTLAAHLDALGHGVGYKHETPMGSLMTFLQRARDGGERLRLITRNLKSFSRSDDTALAPLQLQEVMESSLSMAETEIRHHARLERAYETVPNVEANAALLGQVLLNLLINAAQAIPDGHPETNQITVGSHVEADGWVTVFVRDTGSGISADIRERIFEPFFTTKPVGIGTGLGLSISRNIVESLHGRMSVESDVGVGSTFKVAFPASVAPSIEAAAPPLPTVVAKRRASVMVIDDEVMIGEVLRQVLERDHTVAVFTNARQALDRILAGGQFDVILCDLTMPIMKASEFYQELARIDAKLADSVVFTTGGAFAAANQAFLHNIPNRCLEKPFDINELRQVVQESLR